MEHVYNFFVDFLIFFVSSISRSVFWLQQQQEQEQQQPPHHHQQQDQQHQQWWWCVCKSITEWRHCFDCWLLPTLLPTQTRCEKSLWIPFFLLCWFCVSTLCRSKRTLVYPANDFHEHDALDQLDSQLTEMKSKRNAMFAALPWQRTGFIYYFTLHYIVKCWIINFSSLPSGRVLSRIDMYLNRSKLANLWCMHARVCVCLLCAQMLHILRNEMPFITLIWRLINKWLNWWFFIEIDVLEREWQRQSEMVEFALSDFIASGHHR